MLLEKINENKKIKVTEPTYIFHIPQEILFNQDKDLDLLLSLILLLKNHDKKTHTSSINQEEIRQNDFRQDDLLKCLDWLVSKNFLTTYTIAEISNAVQVQAKYNPKLFMRRSQYGILYDFEVDYFCDHQNDSEVNYKLCLTVLSAIRLKLQIKKTGKMNPKSVVIDDLQFSQDLNIPVEQIDKIISLFVKLDILTQTEDIAEIKNKADIFLYGGQHFVFRYRLQYFNESWGISFPCEKKNYLNGKLILDDEIWRKPKRAIKIQQQTNIKPSRTNIVAKLPYEWFYNKDLTEYRIPFYVYFSFAARKSYFTDQNVTFSVNQIAKWIGCYTQNMKRSSSELSTYDKLKLIAVALSDENYIHDFLPEKFKANKIQTVRFNYDKIFPKSKFFTLYDFESDFLIKHAPCINGLTPTVLMTMLMFIRSNTYKFNSKTKKINQYFTMTYLHMGNVLQIPEKTISKGVDFLEGCGFIKTFRHFPAYINNKWVTFPAIYVMQYRMNLVNNYFEVDLNYNYKTPLEQGKRAIGVYDN